MNRLAPLIRRPSRTQAAFVFPDGVLDLYDEQAAGWLQDLKLFAAGWAAGLVFFGTLIA